MYGPLNDPHFVLLVLSCAAVITIGSLVTALNRIPRAEFARLLQNKQLSKLQNEVEQLSEKIQANVLLPETSRGVTGCIGGNWSTPPAPGPS